MGRLEDECVRVSAIFGTINAHSLCLFDETFSSTESEEGCLLAFEILRAMESYGARTIIETYFHNIISMITQAKAEGACSEFDFLCAGISPRENAGPTA